MHSVLVLLRIRPSIALPVSIQDVIGRVMLPDKLGNTIFKLKINTNLKKGTVYCTDLQR